MPASVIGTAYSNIACLLSLQVSDAKVWFTEKSGAKTWLDCVILHQWFALPAVLYRCIVMHGLQ